MKRSIIIITIVILSYLTGVFQIVMFGDFTNRLGTTFNIQEDSEAVSELLAIRWKIIHAIDQF